MDYLFLLCGRRPATGTFRYMDLGGRTALLTGATGGLGSRLRRRSLRVARSSS